MPWPLSSDPKTILVRWNLSILVGDFGVMFQFHKWYDLSLSYSLVYLTVSSANFIAIDHKFCLMYFVNLHRSLSSAPNCRFQKPSLFRVTTFSSIWCYLRTPVPITWPETFNCLINMPSIPCKANGLNKWNEIEPKLPCTKTDHAHVVAFCGYKKPSSFGYKLCLEHMEIEGKEREE